MSLETFILIQQIIFCLSVDRLEPLLKLVLKQGITIVRHVKYNKAIYQIKE